jgi:AcrR family transcriptional regulator
MARWPEGARERLTAAAMDLFSRHGFAATTVDDVAAAAGVTQRTFFRHFRDKEEVLFADDDRLLEVLVAAIAGAGARPGAPGPERGPAAAATMREALAVLAAELEPAGPELRARSAVIATDVALTGRELAKQARWKQAVAAALVDRGYEPERADLLAGVGFAVFRHALDGWLADPDGPPLLPRVDAAVTELSRSLATP